MPSRRLPWTCATRLDGVVFAAGAVAFGSAVETDDHVLDQLVVLNFMAPAPAPRGDAEQPTAGMAAYSASKAALTAYDAAVARELRRRKVHVLDARPPQAVARRVVEAVLSDERDLPASAF